MNANMKKQIKPGDIFRTEPLNINIIIYEALERERHVMIFDQLKSVDITDNSIKEFGIRGSILPSRISEIGGVQHDFRNGVVTIFIECIMSTYGVLNKVRTRLKISVGQEHQEEWTTLAAYNYLSAHCLCHECCALLNQRNGVTMVEVPADVCETSYIKSLLKKHPMIVNIKCQGFDNLLLNAHL